MTLLPLIEADFEFYPSKQPLYRLGKEQRAENKRCIQVGHSIIQGKVINTHPDGRVVIKNLGEIYTGRPVPQYVRGA